MFWLDAYEHKSKPGTVYLFGKVRHARQHHPNPVKPNPTTPAPQVIVSRSPLRFASCCVVVQGVERVVYLLRRDGCSNKDVYDEVRAACHRCAVLARVTHTPLLPCLVSVDAVEQGHYAALAEA